jgi:Spy/CpxP family protein refolding chaperone
MCILAWLFAVLLLTAGSASAQHRHSPSAGQEQQEIKALSAAEIQALLDGRGMGLAKAAELNHHPGPLHVLELAAPLHLSDAQRQAVQQVYDRMRAEAVRLGHLIVAQEQALDRLFTNADVASNTLQDVVRDIARLQGELRLVHLQAHVDTKVLLAPEQRVRYDALRGYAAQEHQATPVTPQHGQH